MRASRARRELAAEIEAHIAERSDELIEAGVSAAEARRQACREFGNAALFVETGAEVWSWSWLENIAKDFRHAARGLRASPLFTLTAVLSLALGIGANTALFSLLYASLWKPLPVPDPQRIYQLQRGDSSCSYVLFQRFAAVSAGTGEVFAKSHFGSNKFGLDAESRERISGESVTGNFFTALGVRPILGRLFEPDDDSVLGGRHVAVLSSAFWQRRFQSDPSVLGRTVYYDESPYTIVGVAQPGFTGVEAEASMDMWVPVTAPVEKFWLTSPDINWLKILVRLQPGVSPRSAQALYDGAFRAYVAEKLLPQSDAHWRPVLEAQHIALLPAAAGLSTTGHKYEKPLLLLMALVALVLLIACSNVANLIMARNNGRQHELAIRRALGAGPWRIAGQLFSESLLVAAGGAACGLLIAVWATRLLVARMPRPEVPLALDLHPGAPVLAFTAAIALGTAFLFGLIPAWRVRQAGPDCSLRTAGRATRALFRSSRLMVGGQLSLALILLIGAGLFSATLRNLKLAGLGFRSEHVQAFELTFPKGTSEAKKLQDYVQFRERLRGSPGVLAVSYAWPGIYGDGGWSSQLQIPGRPVDPGEDNEIGTIAAGPDFFSVLGMPLNAGRDLTVRDQEEKPPIAVVNESLARHYFGTVDVVGRRIFIAGTKAPREIVGVVRDAHHYGVREKVWRMVYLPAWMIQGGTFYVRMGAAADLSSAMLRAGAAAIDKNAQVENLRPLATDVANQISKERLTASLSAFFGGLAVLLAAVGLYGVVAYGVSQRTNEFGIRMALGAQRRDVERLVLRQTFLLVAAGVTSGLAAAAALVRLLATPLAGMLYGIGPRDGSLFAAAALFLSAIALLAAFLPARRASRVDPTVALRSE